MAWLSKKNLPSGVAICRNRGHDGDGEKNFKFRRVATIVYYGKLQKNQKSDLRTKLKSGSRLRVGKVLAPYNARPKTVPLIEWVRIKHFLIFISFPKNT